ncbi:OmpA family protein [Brevibacillus brevis]|uniref:OmpA family protein n=1 Tax=Brevibacillus brevis TaxID=1393 RepID=UPI000D0F91D2|nr:OmpA family protein [Brevibacillus brevis]PSJ66416.1 chemotaxis protein [Brevibacillus brevis]RED21627.1 chemotaxis protein MotB [Brevibacillus brevis]GEC91875.1 chemotaxis protein MotB [Brevibacillus brevis]VEF86701.1 Chemotaxis protein MotB [Brevibacillus brevis]
MHDERLYDEKELEKSWLLSYSDLITLLFVIVIIIAAMQTKSIQSQKEEVQKEKASLEQVHESLDLLNLQKLELQREVYQLEARQKELKGEKEKEGSEDTVNMPKPPMGMSDSSERDMETVRNQLSSALAELNLDYEESEEGLRIRLPETILFTSGSADLQPQGKQVVGTVAGVLKRFEHKVRIEGYTDDVPISRSSYQSNWELSSARAISVMREMVDAHSLPASRFTVAGLGEYKPLVDNSNAENRAKNRRVEIVILGEKE